MSELSDEDLLREHGLEPETEKATTYSPLEARLIAGFEDITKFHDEHERAPQHGQANDIFERIYAVRLDQLRKLSPTPPYLAALDSYGLLTQPEELIDALDDHEILAAFDMEGLSDDDTDITNLRHVSPMEHRRAAEEVANREVCRDFSTFDLLFKQVRQDLDSGTRITISDTNQDDFEVGRFFILKGQIAYIAERGEDIKATGKNIFDARLRVIFDNGTESALLMRSLQRSFNEPKNNARAISAIDSGPLFGDKGKAENETGIIYVLRSLSELPEIAPIKDSILKIGVTGSTVKKRIANARNDATYLLGEVQIVDEYKLYNINRNKLERLLQRIFANARLEITIKDRFGRPVQPNEWFLTTPDAVARAVELIKSGEIKNYSYDPKNATFVKPLSKLD